MTAGGADLPAWIPSDEDLSVGMRRDRKLEHFAQLRDYEVQHARANLGLIVFHGGNYRVQLERIDDALRLLAEFSVGGAREPDAATAQFLATRLFNDTAAAISLLLEGHYQCSFMIQRDILETGFLLDLFWSSPDLIAKWRYMSRDERKKAFSPVRVRKGLQAVDGVDRQDLYGALCEIAAHPTPDGRLNVSGNHRVVGPRFDQRKLFACLGELARDTPYFAVVVGNLLAGTLPALRDDFDCHLSRLRPWLKRSFKIDLPTFNRNEMASWAKALWTRPTSPPLR